MNLDGKQDSNEPGVRNVDVELYKLDLNGAAELIGAQTTNALGAYRFDGLSDGNYFLIFTPEDEFEFTIQDVGDEAEDSDVEKTGVTDLITITNNYSTDDACGKIAMKMESMA